MNSTNTDFLARLNCLWHFMSAVDLRSIDDLCRLCMSKEDELIPIFYKQPSFHSNELTSWILDCTSVKVTANDGLPSSICHQCHKQLQNWAEFKQRCLEINNTLQECLNESKPRVEGETTGTEQSETDEKVHPNQDGESGEERLEFEELPVESVLVETSEEVPEAHNDESNKESQKKSSILMNTLVLGDKQNTQMNGKLTKQQQQHPEYKFVCKKCGKAFRTAHYLRRHESFHSDVRPFSCPKCQKTFLRKSHLDMHLPYHEAVRKHVCATCGRHFSNGTKLTMHTRVHTGERPYHCSVCSKSFPHKKSLSKHIMTHSKLKPFECSVCQRGFTDKWHLTQHFRLHTGEKPYCCTECGQCFTHNVSLREHMSHHTGEVWSCDLCPKEYSTKSSLSAHFRNVHRE